MAEETDTKITNVEGTSALVRSGKQMSMTGTNASLGDLAAGKALLNGRQRGKRFTSEELEAFLKSEARTVRNYVPEAFLAGALDRLAAESYLELAWDCAPIRPIIVASREKAFVVATMQLVGKKLDRRQCEEFGSALASSSSLLPSWAELAQSCEDALPDWLAADVERIRLQQEEEERDRAERAAMRNAEIQKYLEVSGEPDQLATHRRTRVREHRCERCNEAVLAPRSFMASLFKRPYLCDECSRDRR